MAFPEILSCFPWHGFFTVLSFAWGACIGSFLNVCIYRIPLELSVTMPRSFCPHCKKQIPWYLNVPILSFLMLGARTRCCGNRISPRYFIVELLTAVLFLLVWLKFDFAPGSRPLAMAPITDWKLVPVYWLVVSGLILGTFVDLEHLIIPDRVTIGGIITGLALSPLLPALHEATTALWGFVLSLFGVLLGLSILWTIGFIGKFIFRKDAMGFGDVKLLAAIGAFLGWRAVLFTLMISSLGGSIVGLSLVAMRKKEMRSRIPYGPYIALAAIIWIFWGPALWDAYVYLLSPPASEML